MAGQIRMTPETMRTRATQTSKQADAVQNVIVAMDNLLQALRSEWECDAMRGYEDRYAKIKPSFTNAKELLDEIAYNLRESARAVEETDRNIGSQFRK